MNKKLLTLLTLLLVAVGAKATITAKWDFTSGASPRVAVEYNGKAGSIASDKEGINMWVDAKTGKFDTFNRPGDALITTGAVLYIPVVSTEDQITILGNWKVTYTIGQASSTTDLSITYDVQAADVAIGYVKVTIESNDNYFYSITANLAYQPGSMAIWDWQNGNPTSITNLVTEGTDQSGSIASSITGISLDYMAATSGAYVKLQYRSGENDAHFYTGTEVHIPVASTGDIVTIVSRSGYNFTVGGVAATSLVTKHQATSAEVTAGYVAIVATAESYLYSISLEMRAVLSVSAYQWATFNSPNYALDFTNAKDAVNAYLVTGHEGAAITKSAVTGTLPKNTGLLINAEEGTYAIPVVASSTTDVSSNLMKPGTGAAISAESGKTKYVLGVSGGVAQFLKINATAATVTTDKAYLEFSGTIPTSALDFNGTTGINEVQDSGFNVQGSETFYNLAGQRVETSNLNSQTSKLKKGLYIVNGRKVVIK